MRSVLCIAVDENNYEVAELLIQAGFDSNESIGTKHEENVDYDAKSTSLHIAATRGNKQMIELLLSHGADVNACDSLGRSVLYTAVAEECELSIIEMLLKHGANFMTASRNKISPLHMAMFLRNMQVVKLLMAYGADPKAVTEYGNSLHMLIAWDEDYIYLTNEKERVKIAEDLIDMGVDVNAVNRELLTPLQLAVRTGIENIIELLLDNGASVNVESTADTIPLLHDAVESFSPATVKLLLSKGADVNQRTENGTTALHIACSDRQNVQIIRMLFENGADINAKDSQGRTPFSMLGKEARRRDSEALMMMVKQIVKVMKIENGTVDVDNIRAIQADPQLQKFHDQCLEEIEKMEKLKFYNEMSFFHVFSRHESKIATLLRNEEFKTSYDLKNLRKLFPIYARSFDLKMQKALEIEDSTLKIEKYLYTAFGSRLSTKVINRIAYFSKLDDFPHG